MSKQQDKTVFGLKCSQAVQVVPYTYAAALVLAILWNLVFFERYTEYIGSLFGGDPTLASHGVAALLMTMAVFSIPFLLRMNMRPFAGSISALLVIATPVAWAVATTTTNPGVVLLNAVLIAWAVISFIILGGHKLVKNKQQ